MTASDFDLNEWAGSSARRQAALATGSSHVAMSRHRYDGPRQDAVSELDVPELLYPSQWAERPQRCWNCGAGRASFETTPPYGLVKQGESSCFVCSRVVVRWKDDKTRRPVLTVADLAPAPRGRPPMKRRTPVTDPTERPCLDCTERIAVINRDRCRACSKARREAGRAGSLFRRVMTTGEPMERVVLQRILGLTQSGLASAVERARSHGVRLTTTSRGWLTLEDAPR